MFVYSYELDDENYIISYSQFNKKNYPEFLNNPEPEFIFPFIDKYGIPQYKLIDNQIVYSPQLPSISKKALEEFSKTALVDIVKLILKGIENSEDADFQKFKQLIDSIEKGTFKK